MHDSGFDGLVHGRSIGGSRVLNRRVFGREERIKPLAQGLEASFDATVAFGEAHRFARGFDGRFSVGHGRSEV